MKRKIPKLLRQFPWATLGRREAPAEFFKKHEEQRGRVALLSHKPKISVVIPFFWDFHFPFVAQSLEALRLQSYPFWEAIAVGRPAEKKRLSGFDDRIRWVNSPEAGGEVAWKNYGAQQATGDWLCFAEPEDVISPVAFFHLIYSLERHSYDLIFTNEALLSQSSLSGFLSKREWSWFNLIHFNAVGRMWMVKRAFFEGMGRFDEKMGGAHEEDFFLRAYEQEAKVLHEPFFFYYRRESASPLRSDTNLSSCVSAHLMRKGFAAKVQKTTRGNTTRVVPEIKDPSKHLISGVLCYRDKPEWTIKAAQKLLLQVGKVPLELFVINNQSRPESSAAVREGLKALPFPVKHLDYNRPFNFGNMHNWVLKEHAKGDLFLLLNNDVFWKGQNALDEMAGWAVQPWAGTVGILLRFPDGSIQHGGFRALFGGDARLARVSHVGGNDPYLLENREVFGNTFAAALVKVATINAQGGFREIDLPNGFGDVAFNFTCLRQGLKNVYLGHIEAIHLESASRGMSYEYWEEVEIEREFPDVLQKMLRQDFGINRVPGADFALKAVFRLALTERLTDTFPWLLPLRPVAKKILRGSLKPVLE